MAAATINPLTFLKQVRTELSQVIWPTRDETIKLTMVVIGVSVAVGIFIGLLDVLFTSLTQLLVK